MLKKYFGDVGKVEVIAWMNAQKPKETLKSDDILANDDINKMIEATDGYYWKALIIFLFETGCKVGEINDLKYKDFVDTTEGMIVSIPTKKTSAGYRKVILPSSSRFIKNLQVYTFGKPEDVVFNFGYEYTYLMIRDIAKKAGITKPVSPHKFRHAQATELVKLGIHEAIVAACR
jgi:integrase/recombinase XerD